MNNEDERQYIHTYIRIVEQRLKPSKSNGFVCLTELSFSLD